MARKNERSAVQARKILEDELSLLREMYNEHPVAASFLERADTSLFQFGNHFKVDAEMKSLRRRQQVEKYKKEVVDLRQEIEENMKLLNKELDSQVKKTKEQADRVTKTFNQQ